MYVIVWRFRVKHVDEFREHYGPDGTWARFFRGSPDFVRTDLLANGPEFLTLDWWKSKEDFEKFEKANREEYKRIDAGFERLTVSEERVGAFATDEGQRRKA